MNETRAREILEDDILPDGSLSSGSNCHFEWEVGSERIVIDGSLAAEELEALAWWMRNTHQMTES